MNGLTLEKDLRRTSQRWPVATAAKVDRFVKDKVAAAAGVQSRRVLATAQAELCNRAMRRFVELLYDETPEGRLVNICAGGKVIIATPWSRTRHGDYGLTDHGGRVLRCIVAAKLERMPAAYRLLEHDGGRWYLNLSYGSLPAALGWLKKYPVTADQWLAANDALPRRGHK